MDRNQALSALRNITSDFKKVEASGKVIRPGAGNHVCLLTKLEMEPDTRELSDGREIKGLRCTFHYETVDPMPDTGKNLSFPGKGAFLVLDRAPYEAALNSTDENVQRPTWNIKSDESRFKGALKAILGESYQDNLEVDVDAVLSLVNGQTSTAVEVYCQYKKGKVKPGEDPSKAPEYFTDFINRTISN
jgi:hypothetical protein